MQQPLVLLILDGWGVAPAGPGNAISQATLTHIPDLFASYPHGLLSASGEAVGLPKGEDGNTETGHINIGAGRVVYQDFPRINLSIADGSFFTNEAFLGAIRYADEHKSNLHIMGIVSDSAVHGSLDHLYAFLDLVKMQGNGFGLYLHLFTDGRDSPPTSAKGFISEIELRLKRLGIGNIATVMGRYWAMDRDKRWERTQKAYECLTEGSSVFAPSAISAVEQSYKVGKTDEFIEPTVIVDSRGVPYPRIANHDSVIFYNFRIDRPRQLTRAFVLPDFENHAHADAFDPYAVKYYQKHVVKLDARDKPFVRKIKLPNLFFVTMTQYEQALPCTVAFPLETVSMTVGRIFCELGLRQLRMSETEKERFVGYYFNGMREDPFPGEDRIIVPSPPVATYDLAPKMASEELTQKLVDRISSGIYSFILVNFANPDMVAHTGNIEATKTACEAVDRCIGTIVNTALAYDGTCIITADHGNAEELVRPDGGIDTEHSTNPVPFCFINEKLSGNSATLPTGILADVAPTMLAWKHIAVPSEMTGHNLLSYIHKGGI